MQPAPYFIVGDRSERPPQLGVLRLACGRSLEALRLRLLRGGVGALALLGAGWAAGGVAAAHAAAVFSPYIVTLSEPDPTQAVQEAMRVELVRLTGTREAATDEALAPIVDGARQYVQLERTTTSGQTQVLFDAVPLRAAIETAGRSVWDLNRPLLWISLPAEDPATDQMLRSRLDASAAERGLPILITTGSPLPSPSGSAAAAGAQTNPPNGMPAGSPAGAPAAPPANPPSPASGPAGPAASDRIPSATELLEAAHRAGANAALLARLVPSTPGVLQWTLAAPTTSGQWTGGPELAIENATETLASAARATNQVPVADYQCQITGVSDLASLVNVLAAMQGAPGITNFAIEDIEGTQLTLHLEARANLEQLQRMLVGDRLQASGTGAGGVLEYRYITGR
jgi:hypothetical protein